MIISEDFERRAVGIEVDGVGVEVAVGDAVAVERVIAQADAGVRDGGFDQSVNGPGVRCEVFGRHGGRAEDRGQGVQFRVQRGGQRGARFGQQRSRVGREGRAERGQPRRADRLLGQQQRGDLDRRELRLTEPAAAFQPVMDFAPAFDFENRFAEHQHIHRPFDRPGADAEMARQFLFRPGTFVEQIGQFIEQAGQLTAFRFAEDRVA